MGRKLKLISILITLLGLLLLASPAGAGGWVVITLDALPGPVHAGDTVHLGFMVRQHGMTPTNGVSPTLRAVNGDTGETITVDAEQVGETGHFEVAIVFPAAGEWAWEIGVPPFNQAVSYAPLTVLPAAVESAASATPAAAAGDVRAALRWSGAGLLGLAAALALMGQRRRQRATASTSTA